MSTSPQHSEQPSEVRVTLWNKQEIRKISGNAAPKQANLQQYLKRHPGLEVYVNQDQHLDENERWARAQAAAQRVTIWNNKDGRIISGNAAPLEKNLQEYLRKNPHCEVYAVRQKSLQAQYAQQMQQAGTACCQPTQQYNLGCPTQAAAPSSQNMDMDVDDSEPATEALPPIPFTTALDNFKGENFFPAACVPWGDTWETKLHCVPTVCLPVNDEMNIDGTHDPAFVPMLSCLHTIEAWCFQLNSQMPIEF